MKNKKKTVARKPGSTALDAVWYTVIAATAFFAIGSQLDRQGRTHPQLAKIVPASFQSDTLYERVQSNINSGDYNRAQSIARELILQRPVPAESLTLHVVASLNNGEGDAAIDGLNAAASRSWRDRVLQQLIAATALDQDQPQTAALRVMALWRLGERNETVKQMTRITLENPRGIAAFKEAIGGRELWSTDFLVWSGEHLSLQANRDLSKQFAQRAVQFNCQSFSARLVRLINAGEIKSADAIWSALCSETELNTKHSAKFTPVTAQSGPYDWKYPSQPGVYVETQLLQDNNVLKYYSSNPLMTVIARKYFSLDGRNYNVKIDGSNLGSEVEIRIFCRQNAGVGYRLAVLNNTIHDQNFSIGESCDHQEVIIYSRAGSGIVGNLELRKID